MWEGGGRRVVALSFCLDRIAGFHLCPLALAAPTTEKLIACFTAGTTPDGPAPDGWLPPWLVANCDPAQPDECPG